jgi:anti-sigma regulatory factor (Ser/Thr protein kinase)
VSPFPDPPQDAPDERAAAFRLARDAAGTRALAAALDAVGAAGRARFRCELVAEEILTNLVKYGGPGADGVDLRLVQGPVELRLEVLDDTPPYSPESSEPEALGADRARVKDGGLGLALVRRSCDALYYDRTEAGRNRTVAVFRRDPAEDDSGEEPPVGLDPGALGATDRD